MRLITSRPHRLLSPIISRIGELAAAGERCMLIVPSQYTLQAEIEAMTRLDLTGSFLIDVLSPSRLQSRVFERAGKPEQIVIDEAKAKDWLSKGVQPTETVKTLLIRQGIIEKSEKLSAPRTKTRKKK